MNTITSTIAMVLGLAAGACGEDWDRLLRDVAKDESPATAEARKRVFDRLRLMAAAPPTELQAELRQIIPILKDPEPRVRMQASGLLAGLALTRKDALESMEPAIAAWIESAADGHPRIRANAYMSLASLKPTPPLAAVQLFSQALSDKDRRIAGTAGLGLARLGGQSAEARAVLEQYLTDTTSPDLLVSVIYGIGESKQLNERLISLIAAHLEPARGKAVLIAAVDALAKSGPKASASVPAIRALLAGQTDPEIRTAAERALTAIEGRP